MKKKIWMLALCCLLLAGFTACSMNSDTNNSATDENAGADKDNAGNGAQNGTNNGTGNSAGEGTNQNGSNQNDTGLNNSGSMDQDGVIHDGTEGNGTAGTLSPTVQPNDSTDNGSSDNGSAGGMLRRGAEDLMNGIDNAVDGLTGNPGNAGGTVAR